MLSIGSDFRRHPLFAMFSSSHVMPSRTFSTLQLILFLLFCNFSLHAWYLSFHTARLFKLMDLTFSPPIIHSWSHFRQVPTKESSHEFSFFFLLPIFATAKQRKFSRVFILLSSSHLCQRRQCQQVACRSGEPAGRQCKDPPSRR